MILEDKNGTRFGKIGEHKTYWFISDTVTLSCFVYRGCKSCPVPQSNPAVLTQFSIAPRSIHGCVMISLCHGVLLPSTT